MTLDPHAKPGFQSGTAKTTESNSLLEDIAHRIQSGLLKGGDKLPPLRQFARENGISLRTARSIFTELGRRGLARSIQGDGTYVCYPPRSKQDRHATSGEVFIILPHRAYVATSLDRRFIDELQDQGLLAVVVVEQAHNRQTHDFLDLLEQRWTNAPPNAVVLEGRSERIDRLVKRCLTPQTRIIATFRHPHWVYPGWHSVQLDVAEAHYLATKHLLKQGHKKIGLALKKQKEDPGGHLVPERSQLINALCVQGAQHAVEDYGLEDVIEPLCFAKSKDFDGEPEQDDLEKAVINDTVAWLEAHPKVTAIVGQEPWLWYVRIAAATVRGRRAQEWALVGIGKAHPAHQGDNPCLDWCYDQMAKELAKIIASPADELEGATRHVLVPSRWVDARSYTLAPMSCFRE